MMTRRRLLAFCLVAALCAAGAAWLSAQGSDDDDRPPIIVRSGSITFEGGDRNDAGNPKKCCRNFRKDLFGEQYKPDEAAFDVERFAVTIAAPGCPSSPMTGETVEIDYTENNKTSTFRVYIEPFFFFGTDEPKIDSPVKLHNVRQPKTTGLRRGAGAPGVLDFGGAQGSITRVKVGTGSPCTPTGPAVITIQPKKKHL